MVGLASLAATSCTSTVSNPNLTAGLAPTATSTATPAASAPDGEQEKAAQTGAMASGGTQEVGPRALALAGSTETNALQALNAAAKPAKAAEAQDGAKAETATAAAAEPAAAAPAPQETKTSLFGSSKAKDTPVQTASAAQSAEQPVRTSLFGSSTASASTGASTGAPAAAGADAATDAGAGARAEGDVSADDASTKTEAAYAAPAQAKPTPPKSNGALLRLFSNNNSRPASKRLVAVIDPQSKPELRATKAASGDDSALPSAESYEGKSERLASLPGVRPNAGIQIMQRDSLYDDDDVEAAGTPVILASAAGLARLAPNGLKVQRESVDVACLKPQLVGMLKAIERKYGKNVIVTSGYRSPPYNRKVNGAKASLHMSCAAADIQVPGVSKWELANFARNMSGRGGVGTYCHTESVHVDIGPRRDWNWRCSRRRG